MGGRAAAAAYYPNELVLNILRGMRDTADLAWRSSHEEDASVMEATAMAGALRNEPTFNLAAAMKDEAVRDAVKKFELTVKFADGSQRTVNPDGHVKDRYLDEYTNEVLPHGHAQAGIVNELQYLLDQVIDAVPIEEANADPKGQTNRYQMDYIE